MVKHWKSKTAMALGVLSLFAVWQFDPISVFAKDPSQLLTSDTDDKDWPKCLSAHLEKRFFHTIDATKDQQEKLSTLFSDTMEQNHGLRSEVKQKTSAIIDAFSSDSTTDEQLRQQVADLKAVREKLMASRLDTALKVRAMLTSDQKKLLAQRVKMRFDCWLSSR